MDKAPAAPAAAEKSVKKKRSGLVGWLVLVVLLAAAVLALYFSLRFNFSGMRDKLLEIVSGFDGDYVALAEREQSALEKDGALLEREAAVSSEEARLSKLKAELEQQKKELREEKYNSTPIYRRPLTDEQLASMRSISKTYAQMSPAEAAARIAALKNVEDMAAIIFYMDEKSAAQILEAMDEALASQITKKLLTS